MGKTNITNRHGRILVRIFLSPTLKQLCRDLSKIIEMLAYLIHNIKWLSSDHHNLSYGPRIITLLGQLPAQRNPPALPQIRTAAPYQILLGEPLHTPVI